MKTLTAAIAILAAAAGLFACAAGNCCHCGDCAGGSKTIIATDQAPAAIGPYSQAVLAGDTLYLSGQIAIDPASGQLVQGGIEAETRRVLDNIRAVLAAAGMGFDDVVQVQVFMADLENYSKVNAIYAEYFHKDFPARAAVQVARLPRNVSIEIMAVAVRGAGGAG